MAGGLNTPRHVGSPLLTNTARVVKRSELTITRPAIPTFAFGVVNMRKNLSVSDILGTVFLFAVFWLFVTCPVARGEAPDPVTTITATAPDPVVGCHVDDDDCGAGDSNHTHKCSSCGTEWGGPGHGHSCPSCGRTQTAIYRFGYAPVARPVEAASYSYVSIPRVPDPVISAPTWAPVVKTRLVRVCNGGVCYYVPVQYTETNLYSTVSQTGVRIAQNAPGSFKAYSDAPGVAFGQWAQAGASGQAFMNRPTTRLATFPLRTALRVATMPLRLMSGRVRGGGCP